MNVMGNDRNAPATKGDLEDLELSLIHIYLFAIPVGELSAAL